MIVNAAELPYLPANGHALEYIVFENQVPRVISLRVEKIFLQRLRPHRMLQNIILHRFERELPLAHGANPSTTR